jgi:hypothetical protein
MIQLLTTSSYFLHNPDQAVRLVVLLAVFLAGVLIGIRFVFHLVREYRNELLGRPSQIPPPSKLQVAVEEAIFSGTPRSEARIPSEVEDVMEIRRRVAALKAKRVLPLEPPGNPTAVDDVMELRRRRAEANRRERTS